MSPLLSSTTLTIMALLIFNHVAECKENATCPPLPKHMDCYCTINNLYKDVHSESRGLPVPYFYLYCYYLRKEEDIVEVLKTFNHTYPLPISLLIQEGRFDRIGFRYSGSGSGRAQWSFNTMAPTTAIIGADKVRINITHLILSSNYFVMASPNIFNLLAQTLTELSIIEEPSQSKLAPGHIRSLLRATKPLTNLRSMYLTVPQVEEFDASALSNMANLRDLSIFAERLVTILNPNSFDSTNLSSLTLYSRLSHLPRSLANLPHLTNLSFVSKSFIRASREEFDGFSHLTNLDLSDCAIHRIDPTAWDSLARLEYLYLRFNRLRYLPPYGFSRLANLTFLDLSSNFLESVPRNALSGARHLTHLILDDNHIANLSEGKTFADQGSSLHSLEIGRNRLVEFPTAALVPLLRLNHLNMGRNMIRAIPASAIPPNLSLFNIDLSRNKISEFSDTAMINTRHSLSYLDLSDNQLSTFNFSSLSGYTNLTFLDLSHNNLSVLTGIGILDLMGEKLHFVGLKGNPLDCDCNVLNFIDWFTIWSKGLPELVLWEQKNNLMDSTCSNPQANLTRVSLLDKILIDTMRPICFPEPETTVPVDRNEPDLPGSNSSTTVPIDPTTTTHLPITLVSAKIDQSSSLAPPSPGSSLVRHNMNTVLLVVVSLVLVLVTLLITGLYLRKKGWSVKGIGSNGPTLRGHLPPFMRNPPYHPWNSRHNDTLDIVKHEENEGGEQRDTSMTVGDISGKGHHLSMK